jgi:hypothetical protein
MEPTLGRAILVCETGFANGGHLLFRILGYLGCVILGTIGNSHSAKEIGRTGMARKGRIESLLKMEKESEPKVSATADNTVADTPGSAR